MIDGGALHLLRLHPDKDSEGRSGVGALTRRLSYPKKPCSHIHVCTCRSTHAFFQYHQKIPDGVHTSTDTDAALMRPPYKRFFINFPHAPASMHHVHSCTLDGLLYFLWGLCDHWCSVRTLRMLPERKTEPGSAEKNCSTPDPLIQGAGHTAEARRETYVEQLTGDRG